MSYFTGDLSSRDGRALANVIGEIRPERGRYVGSMDARGLTAGSDIYGRELRLAAGRDFTMDVQVTRASVDDAGTPRRLDFVSVGAPIVTPDDGPGMTPDVLCAVPVLPGLVSAARAVLGLHEAGALAIGGGQLPGGEDRWYEVPRRFGALREALARIDDASS